MRRLRVAEIAYRRNNAQFNCMPHSLPPGDFLLLQNVAPVVGHLPTPVFYRRIKIIIRISTSWCLVLCVESSSVCTVCVNNGYLHFTSRQSNPLSTWGAGICNENLPWGWGISHLIRSNSLVCTTFAQEGGGGGGGGVQQTIDRCIIDAGGGPEMRIQVGRA